MTSETLSKKSVLSSWFRTFVKRGILEVCRKNFLVFQTSVATSSRPGVFLGLIFFNSVSISYSINFPSSTFSLLLRIFWRVCEWFQEDFRADSWDILFTFVFFLLGSQVLVLPSSVLFLPFPLFTVCLAISDCLYSTEFLISFIWPSMCSNCFLIWKWIVCI